MCHCTGIHTIGLGNLRLKCLNSSSANCTDSLSFGCAQFITKMLVVLCSNKWQPSKKSLLFFYWHQSIQFYQYIMTNKYNTVFNRTDKMAIHIFCVISLVCLIMACFVVYCICIYWYSIRYWHSLYVHLIFNVFKIELLPG